MVNIGVNTAVDETEALPVLSVIEGKVMVTSLDVAAVFEKSHKHVLRDIAGIIEECPGEFSRSNFGPRDYKDERGKLQPLYNMTRNGFSLLVMAFTGAKALKFKIAYITKFESMESALVRQREDKLLQNQNRIEVTAWPAWNERALNLMRGEFGMTEIEIKNLRFAIIGFLEGLKPAVFEEAGLKSLQNVFNKGFGLVLIQEHAVN